jgi:hypothetical protein
MTVEELINQLAEMPRHYEVEILLRREPEARDIEAALERMERSAIQKKVWLEA